MGWSAQLFLGSLSGVESRLPPCERRIVDPQLDRGWTTQVVWPPRGQVHMRRVRGPCWCTGDDLFCVASPWPSRFLCQLWVLKWPQGLAMISLLGSIWFKNVWEKSCCFGSSSTCQVRFSSFLCQMSFPLLLSFAHPCRPLLIQHLCKSYRLQWHSNIRANLSDALVKIGILTVTSPYWWHQPGPSSETDTFSIWACPSRAINCHWNVSLTIAYCTRYMPLNLNMGRRYRFNRFQNAGIYTVYNIYYSYISNIHTHTDNLYIHVMSAKKSQNDEDVVWDIWRQQKPTQLARLTKLFKNVCRASRFFAARGVQSGLACKVLFGPDGFIVQLG